MYGVNAKRFQDCFVENATRSKLLMVILLALLGYLPLLQVLSL